MFEIFYPSEVEIQLYNFLYFKQKNNQTRLLIGEE